MRRVHGYNSYRGRSGARTALMIIIAILLVVLLVVVGVYFVLQKYVVYTDDGRARVELPFLEDREPEPDENPGDDPLVIVTDGPLDPDDPLVTGQPEAMADALFAVALPETALTDGSAAAGVEAAGGNAALFDMKGDKGHLNYVSDLQEARNLGTSAADIQINDGIRTLNESGLYTIARVSCFRDNRAPKMDNSLAVHTTGGYNWFDPEDVRWSDPANPYVQGYLVGVCRELAELGFDEILLDYAFFPAEGELNIIRRPEGQTLADRTAALEALYAAVETALAEFPDVKLSIAAAPDSLTGTVGESGQTAELLARYAWRVYAPAEADGEALNRAGLGPDRLVLTNPPAGYRFDAENPALPARVGGLILPIS